MTMRALIEAVVAGEVGWNRLASIAENVIPPREAAISATAYKGSLDAALALHDALLPGWFYCLMDGVAEVRGEMEYGQQYIGKCETTARAWLLAILRAVEAKGGAQ